MSDTTTQGKSVTSKNFKVSDRVKRVSTPGCYGTVKELKQEVSTTAPKSEEERERELMINVLWDNGTLSYLSPAGLEVIRE